MAVPLLKWVVRCVPVPSPARKCRGFSLIELMIVVGFAATLMAIAVPVVTDVSQTTKLNEAAASVERELQSARLRR